MTDYGASQQSRLAQGKHGAVERALPGIEVDIWLRDEYPPQPTQSVLVLAPGKQRGVPASGDARVGSILASHHHAKAVVRQARNDFLHAKVLGIGIVFVGKTRSENGERPC